MERRARWREAAALPGVGIARQLLRATLRPTSDIAACYARDQSLISA
jgi:hypothetical protein